MTSQTLKTSKPKIRLNISKGYKYTNHIVQKNNLHTVCEEAKCPNIYECWDKGIGTIMILGDTCTRSCGFCAVKTGKPVWNDPLEPFRTAMAVKKMKLKHVVVTSVDRDDIKYDYGASIWAETIEQIHLNVPGCNVEVLTPDFKGDKFALSKVLNANPEIFSHNVECIERISKKVRTQANWNTSVNMLKYSVDSGLKTKTGIMVGLGETFVEVVETMKQVVDTGVTIFTIGQYLQPTKNHLSVERYVEKSEFKDYEKIGLEMGFDFVKSGSLVRSSYQADEMV